jgi:tetraacyldisaccharide 4'-kinase
MFKTPKFWQAPNIIALALSPFSMIYLLIYFANKFFTKPQAVKIKILSVGNLTAGGQNKTPTAIAIAKICDELKIKYAFLSRGYQANYQGDLRKVEKNDLASEVGDEPLELNQIAPSYIAKNRYLGAKILSESNQYDLLILDDGLQHHHLKKDLKIMVIDEKIMFGNGLVFPAGPLREPIGFGLKNCDSIIFIEEKNSQLPSELTQKLPQNFSVNEIIKANLQTINHQNFIDKKIIAFCGIAYPQKFFSTLEKLELNIVEKISFADHHSYSPKDLESLMAKLAKHQNPQLNNYSDPNQTILLTTKKDWVKFSKEYQNKISYLDIAIKFSDEDLIKTKLKKLVKC